MDKITCTVEHITFQNPENGYSVLQASMRSSSARLLPEGRKKGYRENQTLVGTFHEVTVGAVLIVEGDWRVDKRYGRQFVAQSSRIVTNAHKINQGQFPDISNGRTSDFFFIRQEDPEQAAREIVNIVSHRIPKAYHIPTSDIQVLAPMQRSVVGATSLNIALQEAINPVGDSLVRGGFRYRKGDRVMQIRNRSALPLA